MRSSAPRSGRGPSGFASLILGVGACLAAAAPSAAQDQDAGRPSEPGARAPLLLNLMSRPLETPERAMQEAVREDIRNPRPSGNPDVEVLPDGSVRIGRARVSVTVKEACPEETHGFDASPRPLPGRGRR